MHFSLCESQSLSDKHRTVHISIKKMYIWLHIDGFLSFFSSQEKLENSSREMCVLGKPTWRRIIIVRFFFASLAFNRRWKRRKWSHLSGKYFHRYWLNLPIRSLSCMIHFCWTVNDQVLFKDEVRLSGKVKLEINFVSGVYFSTFVLFLFRGGSDDSWKGEVTENIAGAPPNRFPSSVRGVIALYTYSTSIVWGRVCYKVKTVHKMWRAEGWSSKSLFVLVAFTPYQLLR